jgi:hypothetical protein
MSTLFMRSFLIAVAIAVASFRVVLAHEMTVKGTVAAIEATRIQVKTGEEKKGEAPAWYLVDAKTKIVRDKTTVTFDAAKIKTGERVVVIVNHEATGKMTALEIHLAAQ